MPETVPNSYSSTDTLSSPSLQTDTSAVEIFSADTVPADSLPLATVDSLIESVAEILPDSLSSDTSALNRQTPKSSQLTDILKYKANDSIVKDFTTSKAYLYGKADIKYGQVELKAATVEIDLEENTLYARGQKDPASNDYIDKPEFKDAAQTFTSDTMKYNYTTKKGLIKNIITADQDGLIYGEDVKKVSDDVFYIAGGKYTTDKSPDPEFYIRSEQIKMNTGDNAVTGPAQMWIAGVPTLLWLPFSFFPLSNRKSSGLIMPTFAENPSDGLSLQNGGLYLALSEFFDLRLTGDVFTKGTWGVRGQSTYKYRYNFSGSFSFDYSEIVNSRLGRDDFSRRTAYNLRWSHNQDPKAHPTMNFSANVNFGSSDFYRATYNTFNDDQFLNNTINSSISFSKRWEDSPFSFNSGISFSQNSNSQTTNFTLPNFSLNMKRQNPFAVRGTSKDTWWKRIGVDYRLQGRNTVSLKDSLIFTEKFFTEARNGLSHAASVSTNVKALQYINISFNGSYNERWGFAREDRSIIQETNQVKRDTTFGFFAVRDFRLSTSASTTLYGLFFNQSLRHVLRPSVSYNYSPDFSTDFWGYYDSYVDTAGVETQYSPFSINAYGVPGRGKTSSVSLSLANTLEAKIAGDTDTAEAKKIKIIEALTVSTGYNFEAERFKMSNVSVRGNSTLFESQRVNYSFTFDPYFVNENNVREDEFSVNKGGPLLRLTNANLATSFSIDQSTFMGGGDDEGGADSVGLSAEAGKEEASAFFEGREVREVKKRKSFYRYYLLPWSLSVSYSWNFRKPNNDEGQINQTLRFNGSISPTPRFKVTFSSGYDLENNDFTYTSFGITREWESFRMNINWVPFGTRTSYFFFIGMKSSIFQDLKYEERSTPDKNIFFQ